MPLAEHADKGLTPYERETLAKLKLAPQDAVSGGLDKLIQAVRDEDARALAHESPIDPATPPLKFDDAAVPSIDDLTPEQRDRVVAKIKETMAAAAVQPGRQPSSGAAQVPGLVAAVAAADSAPALHTREEEAAPAVDADADTGVDLRVRNCPRCRWDLARSDTLEIGRDDKLAWIASLHGARYKKAYVLLNGHVRVVFRSLASKETEAVYHQVGLDFRNRPFDIGAFTTEVHQYRLALSLESVSFSDGAVLVVPSDALSKTVPDASGKTPLVALREHVAEHVLASESLARVVHRKFAEFQRLVEWMEENSDNPDFMKEISALS